MSEVKYHDKLRELMKEYAHFTYDITERFPKSEIFGSTSQIRRSALSVLLNYTEGFARRRKAVMENFYEIAYGSLKESLIISEFGMERKYISKTDFDKLTKIGDEIGKMLWPLLPKN